MVFQTSTDKLEGHFQDTGTLFTIETNPAMFTLLTSKLYTYPSRAVIREWSTNAIDACVASNKPVKFDVHLPTPLQPYFKVRDYGSGLSNDSINSLYCTLGASTKRDSNELTGSFGIGRLAGLSYGSAFTITSYYQGQASTFIVHSEQGVLKLNTLGSAPTLEESGLEVTVQVPVYSIEEFTREATWIYSWFSTLPHCNKPLYKEYFPEVGEWGLIKKEHKNGISTGLLLMGNIVYPLQDSDLVDILIHAPIGAVNITPNREALVLDATTVEYLDGVKKDIIKNFHDNTQKTLDTLPSTKDKILMLIERGEKYRKVVGIHPPIKELLPEVAHLVEWTASTSYYTRDTLRVTFLFDPRRVSKLTCKYAYGKRPGNCFTVFFTDWVDSNKPIILVDIPLTTQDYLHPTIRGKNVLFITPQDNTLEEVAAIEKDLALLGLSMVRSSTFVAPVAKKTKIKVTEIKGIQAIFTQTVGVISKYSTRPEKLDEKQEYLYIIVNGAACEIHPSLELTYRLLKRVGVNLPAVVFIQRQYLPLLKNASNLSPLKETLQLHLNARAFATRQKDISQWSTSMVDRVLASQNAPKDVFIKALAENSLSTQYHITGDELKIIQEKFTLKVYESYVPYTSRELEKQYPLLYTLSFTQDVSQLRHYFNIETAKPLPIKEENYSKNDPVGTTAVLSSMVFNSTA